MRNRAIQVKMVKTSEEPPQPSPKVDHYVALATVSVERIAENVTAALVLYMIADTFRQSVLHVVRTKIK